MVILIDKLNADPNYEGPLSSVRLVGRQVGGGSVIQAHMTPEQARSLARQLLSAAQYHDPEGAEESDGPWGPRFHRDDNPWDDA